MKRISAGKALAVSALLASVQASWAQTNRKIQVEPVTNWVRVSFTDKNTGDFHEYWCHKADCMPLMFAGDTTYSSHVNGKFGTWGGYNSGGTYYALDNVPLLIIDERSAEKLDGGPYRFQSIRSAYSAYVSYNNKSGKNVKPPDVLWIFQGTDYSQENNLGPGALNFTPYLVEANVLVQDAGQIESLLPGLYAKLLRGFSVCEPGKNGYDVYYKDDADSIINRRFAFVEFELERARLSDANGAAARVHSAPAFNSTQRTEEGARAFAQATQLNNWTVALNYLAQNPASTMPADRLGKFEQNFLPIRMGLTGYIQSFAKDWERASREEGARKEFVSFWRAFVIAALERWVKEEYARVSASNAGKPSDWSPETSWAAILDETYKALKQRDSSAAAPQWKYQGTRPASADVPGTGTKNPPPGPNKVKFD